MRFTALLIIGNIRLLISQQGVLKCIIWNIQCKYLHLLSIYFINWNMFSLQSALIRHNVKSLITCLSSGPGPVWVPNRPMLDRGRGLSGGDWQPAVLRLWSARHGNLSTDMPRQQWLQIFLHSMEKKSTKVDFSPISCKKAPFYTRNGHF